MSKPEVHYGVTKKMKELKFWDKNPNTMSFQEFDGLKNSLQEFDVVEPIVIAEDGEILGGNHRATALYQMFGDNADVPCTEVLGLTREQKDKLGLALNKIHGSNDPVKLKALIDTFENPNDLLNLGFQESELRFLDVDLKVFDGGGDDFASSKPIKDGQEIECPACHFKFKKKKTATMGSEKGQAAFLGTMEK